MLTRMLAIPAYSALKSVVKNIYFADRFQRRLALRRLAKDSSVGTLSVERKTGAITLRTDEFEIAVVIRLGYVGIQVKERVDIATVAGSSI